MTVLLVQDAENSLVDPARIQDAIVKGKDSFDEAKRTSLHAQVADSDLSLRTRARQQSLVAAFGRQALMNTELESLFRQALFIVQEGLELSSCRILELSQERRHATVKAVAGWEKQWEGRRVAFDKVWSLPGTCTPDLTIPAGETGHENEMLSAEMLKSIGITAGIEVLIAGLAGPFGVLGAYAQNVQEFSQEDVDFLQSVANMLEAAVERKHSEEKLAYLAQFDSLTGLPNRSLFHDRLAQTLKQAERNKWLVGVLFVDLDKFKSINDTLGHRLGDDLLKMVASRLQQCVRNVDTVSRLGGDEFVIVLADLASPDGAGHVAKKILKTFTKGFELGGTESHMTASIGIALYPLDAKEADTLLENADKAMYRAKEQGRSRYQYYLPKMHARSALRLQLERELRKALDRNEFRLHYQPKADLNTGQICGLEALLRWQPPGLGLVQPDEFIPVLEETGLIVPVGHWVIHEVCRQLRQWQDLGLQPCPVAINLSARQFQQATLDAVIGNIIEASRIPPALLELELTESMLMQDAESAARILGNLKKRGVRLAVDDFGTGYSSLAYLKRFPLNVLKIDKTFVRDCTTDPDDAMIAVTIINLAHNLKLKVVAEGVETDRQLNFLRKHGCDQVQGFYFARPMEAEQTTSALRNNLRLSRPAPEVSTPTPVLLLVDDNRNDLLLFREALSEDGYRILTAGDARSALDILAGEPVDVIVSDQRMYPMSGVPFLAAARKLYPYCLRVLLTGSEVTEALPEAVNDAAIHKYLSKHWSHERLRAELRDVCRLFMDRREKPDAP